MEIDFEHLQTYMFHNTVKTAAFDVPEHHLLPIDDETGFFNDRQ